MYGSTPIVSVIMPVFNGRRYAEEAIESILNQSFQDFELLIVDDCSTDETWKILQRYQQLNPEKVFIWRQPKNGGAFAATNRALEKARGKYIALMDSDDVALSNRLEKQVQFLESHQDILVVGGQVNIIDNQGTIVAQKHLPLHHKEIFEQYALIHPMVHPTCMIRKVLPNGQTWSYHNRFGVNDDYFTLFTLLVQGKFANLEDTVLNYRIHFKNSSLVQLKRCFFNTVKIRWTMFRHYKYPFTIFQMLLIALQIPIVFLTPQFLIFKVYLYCRNIKQTHTSYHTFQFPKLAKQYLVSLQQILL